MKRQHNFLIRSFDHELAKQLSAELFGFLGTYQEGKQTRRYQYTAIDDATRN